MRSKKLKSIVAFLCILVIIAYTFIVLLPHSHDCVGTDCTVCALIEISRNTFIGLSVATLVHQLADIFFIIISVFQGGIFRGWLSRK